MRNALKRLILITPFVFAANVFAHGITEPQHGGIVKVVGDISLELVNRDGQVAVYVLDDEAYDTSGMTGKIKVENSGGKSEYTLVPIKEGGLQAEGASIPGGSEVLVVITKADGYSKIAGKFQVQ